MDAGDCFIFRSGDDGNHLYIVVSDPSYNQKEILILNLTTLRGVPFEDLSCVFQPGEHAWIVNPSYVAYQSPFPRVYSNAQLDLFERNKTIRMEDPFSDHLLARIRQGAAVTTRLEKRFLKLLQDQGLC